MKCQFNYCRTESKLVEIHWIGRIFWSQLIQNWFNFVNFVPFSARNGANFRHFNRWVLKFDDDFIDFVYCFAESEVNLRPPTRITVELKGKCIKRWWILVQFSGIASELVEFNWFSANCRRLSRQHIRPEVENGNTARN